LSVTARLVGPTRGLAVPWDDRRKSATERITEAEQLAAHAVETSGGVAAEERAIIAQAATVRALLALADAILSLGDPPPPMPAPEPKEGLRAKPPVVPAPTPEEDPTGRVITDPGALNVIKSALERIEERLARPPGLIHPVRGDVVRSEDPHDLRATRTPTANSV
jgi:hypothetical protein